MAGAPTVELGKGRRLPTNEARTVGGVGDEIGSWRIDRQLAEGGMSVVFAAHHRFLDRDAAIKIASALDGDGEMRERFLREAQVLARLEHPGVAEVYDVGVLSDGRPWMAMELLYGRTIAEIADTELIEASKAIEWLRQIADVLSAAHAIGAIHRDIKPGNLFVGDDSRVRLLDWGIAFQRAPSRDRLTQGRLLIGTPTYIAPEQARGLEVDGAADVYSLGVVAYELFAHHLPFEGPTDVDLAAQHVLAEPPPLRAAWPEAPARLEGLVMCMLAKDPDRRPHIDDVDRELAAIAPLLR
jgi:serine/threonine-protein kinase